MPKQLSTSDKSRGGLVTKSQTLQRQDKIEKLLHAGYSLTQIASGKDENGKTIGSITTIRKDIDIIRSRWLDMDPEWFHRARLARIDTVERLKAQLIRINKLILEITKGTYDNRIQSAEQGGTFIAKSNGDRPKKLTYAESQLTVVIKAIYEIDADFDPEQYIDKKIAESINNKIKKAETTTS